MPGTFSRNTNEGRTSRTILATSKKSPLRSPSKPARVPATLRSWQGNPAETRSTLPRQGFPSNVRRSSQIGTPGNLARRTSCGKAAISTKHTGLTHSPSARSAPPIPGHKPIPFSTLPPSYSPRPSDEERWLSKVPSRILLRPRSTRCRILLFHASELIALRTKQGHVGFV